MRLRRPGAASDASCAPPPHWAVQKLLQSCLTESPACAMSEGRRETELSATRVGYAYGHEHRDMQRALLKLSLH